jgi:hypothetical protein
MKQKTVVLILYVMCALPLFSQIINVDALQVKPTTTVYLSDECTNKATGTHNNDDLIPLPFISGINIAKRSHLDMVGTMPNASAMLLFA